MKPGLLAAILVCFLGACNNSEQPTNQRDSTMHNDLPTDSVRITDSSSSSHGDTASYERLPAKNN